MGVRERKTKRVKVRLSLARLKLVYYAGGYIADIPELFVCIPHQRSLYFLRCPLPRSPQYFRIRPPQLFPARYRSTLLRSFLHLLETASAKQFSFIFFYQKHPRRSTLLYTISVSVCVLSFSAGLLSFITTLLRACVCVCANFLL